MVLPNVHVVVIAQEVSAEEAYDDFKRIFQRFASAEQVTGAEPLGEDTDEEADLDDDAAADQVLFPSHNPPYPLCSISSFCSRLCTPQWPLTITSCVSFPANTPLLFRRPPRARGCLEHQRMIHSNR